MADPMMSMGDDESQEGEQQPGGYCIELHVKADGSMSISVESEQEETGEEQTADEGTPVQGLKDAMQVIMDIVKNGGQLPEANEGEDDFNSGYNQDQSGGSKAGDLAKRFA